MHIIKYQIFNILSKSHSFKRLHSDVLYMILSAFPLHPLYLFFFHIVFVLSVLMNCKISQMFQISFFLSFQHSFSSPLL